MKFLSFLFFGIFSLCLSAQLDNRPPNIILIMVDDLGAECVNSYGGSSYSTPRLTHMAESGMQFENCHSMPICTPSRVKLMTGRSNKKNHVNFAYLHPNEKTFSQVLKSNGYETLIAGKWQLGQDKKLPKHFGFDEHILWQLNTQGRDSLGLDKRYSNPRLVENGVTYEKNEGEFSTDLIIDYINEFMARKKNQPFLVYYPMILTHCPFVPTPHSEDWDPNDLGSKTYKGDEKYFGDMVYYMDYSVGRIIDKVGDLGIEENTMIIFTADNGTDQPVVSIKNNISIDGAKGKTIDTGTHVPLLVSWSKTIESGIINKSLIDFSDFFPTICEAAGIKLNSNLDLNGVSFYKQLIGQDGPKRKWIHSWYSRGGGSSMNDETFEWVRNETYKFYRGNKFYNVKKDPNEKNKLSWNQMTIEERKIQQEFSNVLKSYNGLRNNTRINESL